MIIHSFILNNPYIAESFIYRQHEKGNKEEGRKKVRKKKENIHISTYGATFANYSEMISYQNLVINTDFNPLITSYIRII